MIPLVVNAEYIDQYKILISFNDGTQGEVDFYPELEGEIFEPLKDLNFFRRFHIAGGTIAWENGADFAPEFLKDQINVPVRN